jgi:8-oxo-dGTP pyrophosphatase MutT (NUDIX family)
MAAATYAGAGFVLLSPDRQSVLLVHDTRSGKWGFPKGHRETCDSNDIDTAIRECKEETGLTATDYVIHNEPFKISKGSQSYIFRYAFLKEGRESAVTSLNPREISALQWVPVQRLLEAQTIVDGNKYLRTWISDVQANIPKKSVSLFRTFGVSRSASTCA